MTVLQRLGTMDVILKFGYQMPQGKLAGFGRKLMVFGRKNASSGSRHPQAGSGAKQDRTGGATALPLYEIT